MTSTLRKGKVKTKKGKENTQKGKVRTQKGLATMQKRVDLGIRAGSHPKRATVPVVTVITLNLKCALTRLPAMTHLFEWANLSAQGSSAHTGTLATTKDCQGSGHLDRHHRNTAGADPSAPKAWANPTKSKGDGKGKAKGEGKKGDRRLDFTDDHTQSQDTRTHAQKLLDDSSFSFQ